MSSELDPIFVTGGSSGIGAALVEHLAGDFEVLTAARRIDRMEREYADNPHIHPYELDLRDAAAITDLLGDLLEEYEHIPYAINCAGIWTPKPVVEITEEDMLEAMQVDAFSQVHVMRELLPAMRDHDYGRIVNVSGAATLEPAAGWALQYASIWARNAFGVAAALENDDRNIKINLMGPGPSNTEMYEGPLPPTACHPTVEYLLGLDEDGPTGRFFWLGYELPMFPDLGTTDTAEGVPDEDHLERVVPD